jgi:hypothetical protein
MNTNDNTGLGAAPPAATITSDIQQLQAIGGYLNGINTAAAGLKDDSNAVTTQATTAQANLTGVIAPDILAAYNAIFGSAAGTPADMATAVTYAANDFANLNAAYIALQATVASQQTQIASLQAQISGKASPPASSTTNPNQMTTTTFLVGVASVLAIGGGVWWVARNAKTKAREAHASGAFKPKVAADAAAAANPKKLTSGSKR